VGDRYLSKGQGIFLDTLPGYPPTATIEELPEAWLAYLRLSALRLQVPLVYDLTSLEPNADAPTLLLEEAALWQPERSVLAGSPHKLPVVAILPAIAPLWEKVSGRRQLAWLWQLANLWEPMLKEGVASTLLTPDFLRVEGCLVRILELRPDNPEQPPTLSQLGSLWQTWRTTAQSDIVPFLDTLSLALVEGSISTAAALLEELDQQIAIANRGKSRHIHIATQTDQGPTRSRNEDACYPASGTLQSEILDSTQSSAPLVVVCDGIGGHQGGDVASNLAIAAVHQKLQNLPIATLSPEAIAQVLDESVAIANDRISQRNDDESRQDRQRMGTTLVMGLIKNHELYMAHVGDSRAYWITPWGCHQVTLDDDVASRQMRLGYNFYRQALQHPNAGSLVQALGMSTSKLLHPTVQRFLVDEDGVFLFCSDGLSDGDRIEEYWDTDLLPVLRGQVDLTRVSQRLVEIANTLNGHDNVTVAVVHCQVQEAASDLALLKEYMASTASDVRSPAPLPPEPLPSPTLANPTVLAEKAAPTVAPPRRPLPVLLSLVFAAVLGGILIYLLLPLMRGLIVQQPDTAPSLTPSPSPADPATTQPLAPGSLIQVGRVETSPSTPLLLAPQPQLDAATAKVIPPGTVLQILEKPPIEGNPWLRVVICAVGSDETTDPSLVSPVATPVPAASPIQTGEEGWLVEADLLPRAMPVAPEVIPGSGCGAAIPPLPADPSTLPPLG